jgi:hypothetical protein
MASDEQIEAAFKAMRAIRIRNGEVHDDVLRAYARAALLAAERLEIETYRMRATELRKRAERLADEAHQVATTWSGTRDRLG